MVWQRDCRAKVNNSDMFYYAVKIFLSALVVFTVSEIAKRSTTFAAFVASLPITSLLVFVWLHVEGSSSEHIAELSNQIFWLVLPSLVFFLLLPILIHRGFIFWMSMGLSITATACVYLILFPLLRHIGMIE